MALAMFTFLKSSHLSRSSSDEKTIIVLPIQEALKEIMLASWISCVNSACKYRQFTDGILKKSHQVLRLASSKIEILLTKTILVSTQSVLKTFNKIDIFSVISLWLA